MTYRDLTMSDGHDPHADAPALEPDPRLGALLRATVPAEEPAWDALHAAIMSRAALPLARIRAAHHENVEWWEPASHWARAALPLAIAASIALIIGLSRFRELPVQTAATPSVRAAFVRVVASSEEDGNLLHALIGSASDESWAAGGAIDRE